MRLLKDKFLSHKAVIEDFESEKGPFFGNKFRSPMLPDKLSKWSRIAFITVGGFAFIFLLFQIYLTISNETSKEGLGNSKLEDAKITNLTSIKPFLEYVSQFKKREIFNIYQVPGKAVIAVLPQVSLKELAANLVLSGVIFEDEPQAIIEDKNKNKTYILKVGDYLENIKIESISRGKVTLRLDSQTVDLEL